MQRLFIYEAILAVIIFLGIKSCKAWGYTLLEPRSVMIEGEYFDIHRDPYLRQYDGAWTYGAALGTEITLLGDKNWRAFYDPTLYFRSTTSQIREGHLQYSAGLEVNHGRRGFRLFRYHESRHALEANPSYKDYPLTDSYKLQLLWRFK